MTDTAIDINAPYTLPCGLQLKNRLVKAAMTEGLADASGTATDKLANLYDLWAQSGVGLLITGNILVDRFHLERAGNVVIDGPQSDARMAALRAYAEAAQQNGTACFVQLSHAGRQTPVNINPSPKSASNIQLGLPGGQYARPTSLTEGEIEAIIGKFSLAAKACQEAGFQGVQIHSAHGYLLSQFLSPLANKRTDRWGGNLENRARLLIEIISEVRRVVGDDYPVTVKLNSSDFQEDGFLFDDCLQVVKWLNALNIDMLEISGGTYEQPKMVGLDGALEPIYDGDKPQKESTQAREAFFLNYAATIGKIAEMPLMVTGGFRTRAAMNAALCAGETDLIGLARPMVPYPLCTKELLTGKIDKLPDEVDFMPTSKLIHAASPFKLLRLAFGLGEMGWYYQKILEMGAGRMPNLNQGLWSALIRHRQADGILAKKCRSYLTNS